MITSALIAQLRRKHKDQPKAAQVIRQGDGASTLFNLGESRVPIMEKSYSVYKGTSAMTETTDYALDLDTGDLQFVAAPTSAVSVKVNFKYSNFRDRHWMDAINDGIKKMNGRGFNVETVRDTSSVVISANTQVIGCPSGTVEVYELLSNDGQGNYAYIPAVNWRYNTNANKIVLGYKPSVASSAAISYFRRMNDVEATSSTIDVGKDTWLEPIAKAAGAYYFSNRAATVAQQGNASIEEGHFSFSNMRAQGKDLLNEFEMDARRMKPVQASKNTRYHIPGGGDA